MSDETTKAYKLVTEKIKEMQPLFDRMDEDEKLYLLEPYKMKTLDTTKDEKDVANVTLNDPLLYAKKAIAITGSYQRQTVIEGKDLTDKQTTKIEQFLEDIFYMVNEWLPKRDIPSLEGFINEKACIRGSIPGRSCIKLDDKGSIVPDIVPLDRRWFPYDTDGNGFMWAAPISRRSKALIERQYQKEGDRLGKIGLANKNPEVVDFWNEEVNVVFVDKQVIREQPNPYGYVPFVHSICPIGSMLSTEDALKHQGESIFWPNRNLWKEKNEIATILKTLTRKALKGGLQLHVERPEDANKPDKSPFKEDVVIPVEKGGGFEQLPVNDIKSATRLLYSIVETCLQRGELTPLDYGTLTFPLSSVAIMNLLNARNDIFAPILSMIASYYQALSRMIINQCISLGQTIKLGRPGGYNTYSPSDFGGEYSIKYQFFLLSKEQTAADLSMAGAARGVLSDDYIRRDILKVPDPDGMKIELESEQAEKTDEALFLYRRASSLLAKDKPSQQDQIEAYILGQRIVTILTQRKSMGQLSPIEGKGGPEPKGKELLPLFSGGGGGGRTAAPTEEGENAEQV